MPRRLRPVGLESSADLARKMEVLEREMAAQRDAMERLKQMAAAEARDTRPARGADPDEHTA